MREYHSTSKQIKAVEKLKDTVEIPLVLFFQTLYYYNIKLPFQIKILFFSPNLINILFSTLERAVRYWENVRDCDNKIKLNFSSHTNYTAYHHIMDIMCS